MKYLLINLIFFSHNVPQGDVWIKSAQSVSEDAGNARQPRIFFLVSFFQLIRQYYISLAILVVKFHLIKNENCKTFIRKFQITT